MNTALAFIGALGGLAVFGGAVWAIIRAIARQIAATEQNTVTNKANTEATQSNTKAIRELEDKVDTLDRTVFQHGEKISNQGNEIIRLKDAINGHPGR